MLDVSHARQRAGIGITILARSADLFPCVPEYTPPRIVLHT